MVFLKNNLQMSWKNVTVLKKKKKKKPKCLQKALQSILKKTWKTEKFPEKALRSFSKKVKWKIGKCT